MTDTTATGYIAPPSHHSPTGLPAVWAPRWGLRALIAVTLVFVGVISVLAMATVSVTAAQDALAANLHDRLAVQSQRRVERFISLLDELQGDVRLLGKVPPIQGLIRTTRNQGIDPVDGSSTALWTTRLQSIFRGILLAKPHYLQVRYIGLADGGLELVRVERDHRDGDIRVATRLQRTGDRHYVARAAALPPGQIYLSAIELNREFGAIQTPYTPVLRAALPIHDSHSGRPFAVLVVNLRADYFFDALRAMKSDALQLALTNSDGEYLLHPQGEDTFAFEHGRSHNAVADYPALAAVLATGEAASQLDKDTRQFVDMQRISYGDRQALGLVLSMSTDALTEFSARISKQLALALLAICLACAGFAVLVAHLIAAPIKQLSSALDNWKPGDDVPPLPVHSYGEARSLAGVLDRVFTSLAHRNRELEATNRELDQFAYIASHDLQEPVRTVTSFAEMLRNDIGNTLTPRSEKGLYYMLRACDRMRSLIQGLLEYSRIGHHADATTVHLQSVVDGVLLDMSATILARKAEISVISPLPAMRLYEAETRLLLTHLIANAIKFCPEDRIPQVRLSATARTETSCRLLIQDNGIGVPENQQDRIFTIFQRAVGREDFEGTGIGLAHCRKIVDLHHGRIWIDASSPEGTTFAVELEDVR